MRNLHARIVDELGRLIVEGALGDGQPLVPEELGRRFSASRTVVREALRVLESKGMVTARPRVGTWTLPPEAWDAIDPDVIAWRVGGPGGREHLRELLELRLAIEPQAARMAALHRRPDELSAMAAAYAQMADAEDTAAFEAADAQFHAALVRAAGNTLIAQLQVPVVAALRAQGEPVDTLVAHSRVLTLVLAKNADGAETACRRLLETVAAYR
ncbi:MULTISPECIES: FadR/GntR family transcriptional regulator [Amycolatopsis]|uniref:GntR family transcriptional regulator n=1 Tax=Amycolatopsis bullii TaxID=941987 RepID=A0ABQ3KVR2_9PSEU|nr:FCD domain-containing protein [Amycolatopsis bullii]GHG47604.1 GntR family transcriptional regulator [Amycolatopsis bullii]